MPVERLLIYLKPVATRVRPTPAPTYELCAGELCSRAASSGGLSDRWKLSPSTLTMIRPACPCGGIGRRAALKIRWWHHRARVRMRADASKLLQPDFQR